MILTSTFSYRKGLILICSIPQHHMTCPSAVNCLSKKKIGYTRLGPHRHCFWSVYCFFFLAAKIRGVKGGIRRPSKTFCGVLLGAPWYRHAMPSPRRFPPPWSIEDNGACFIARDHNGQWLAYFYYQEDPGRRSTADVRHQIVKDVSAGSMSFAADTLARDTLGS